jgi:TolB-like protein/tetratricopeptide (TPR) repeat protein
MLATANLAGTIVETIRWSGASKPMLHRHGIQVIIAGMTSFFEELKRRNVLRVAAAYGVVAWIIIEAGSVLLPTFGASETTFQVYTLIVIAGFLISLVFAWVFELTPEGVKLEKNVDRSKSITPRTGRRFDFIIIGLLIIALGISVTLNVTGMRDAPAAIVPDRLSIAVLPFESLSSDPDNMLFTNGIHDDLLTRLANIGALKVISRTSVMEYRDTNKKLRQIADELGVGTILEGTVQRAGDNVRINAQLIDARTDDHIWAKSYDRQLTTENIFAIQSEISEEISGALRATLTEDEHTRLASVPTDNMTAYGLYTQGRANLYERRLETLTKAREQFEQAAALDPDYAEAYVGIADSLLLLFNNHAAIPREEAMSLSRAALDKALLLDPNLADAYASLGLLKTKTWEETRAGPELEEAEAAFERAIQLNPNDPRAYMWFASVRTNQERFDEAIALYLQALRVDPHGRIPYANLPMLYAVQGRNPDALELNLKAIRMHPEFPTFYYNLAQQLAGLGRFDEAIAWGLRGQELDSDPLGGISVVGPYVEFGEFDKALNSVSGLPADHPMYALGDGISRLAAMDFSGAVEAFENVVEESENPRQFMYDLIATVAVLAGDYEMARKYAELDDPEFAADAEPTVDRFNIADIVRYAFILQKLGEKHRAGSLLSAALPFVQTLPRIGAAGHGIRDVQIMALQGKTFEALATLREAIDEGFRGTVSSNGWPMSIDPYLESLRDQPEFQAMVAEIDDAVASMHERVNRAEMTGDWEAVRALTDSG